MSDLRLLIGGPFDGRWVGNIKPGEEVVQYPRRKGHHVVYDTYVRFYLPVGNGAIEFYTIQNMSPEAAILRLMNNYRPGGSSDEAA